MKYTPYYSVIVPVYNSELNLQRCIDSILNQSYKDFELILIDDGSSDNSGELCDKYAKQDERIIVLHQENQGVSVARNEGIKKARGQYIVFVDSDDFVESDLLKNLDKGEADFVLVGFSDYTNNEISKVIITENNNWKITSDEDIRAFLDSESAVFVWGKRYKKSILDRFNIRFRPDMIFNEDIIFNNDYILKTNTIVNVKWSGYYHCQYEFDTLSSAAEKVSFLERTKWRKIAHKQYENHPIIQKIYANQMLYFAEKEILLICSSDMSILDIHKKIYQILKDEYFQVCLELLSNTFSKSLYIIYKWKLVSLVMIKYKLNRRKVNI